MPTSATLARFMPRCTNPLLPPNSREAPTTGLRAFIFSASRLGVNSNPVWARFTAMAISIAPMNSGASARLTPTVVRNSSG